MHWGFWFDLVSLIAVIVVSIWITKDIWKGKPLTWIDKIFITMSMLNSVIMSIDYLLKETIK